MCHHLSKFKCLQDALGAIDGTHVPVIVPKEIQERFRNRHGWISQNVMAVVSFDMHFQFLCAGWEGSAADMRVMQSCLDDRSFSIPEGNVMDESVIHNTFVVSEPCQNQNLHVPCREVLSC